MITHTKIGAQGRFGNQIFQLAAMMGLSKHLGTAFCIPIENKADRFGSLYDMHLQKWIYHNFELDQSFKIPNSIFRPISEIEITHPYVEPGFQFDSEFFNLPDGTNLDGFFPSEKYFQNAIPEVRQMFQFRDEIETQTNEILSKMPNIPKVSIHVRHGDYLGHPGWRILPPSYYTTAIQQHFSDSPYYYVIISDDPTWCRNTFRGNTNFEVIETNNSYIDMCLMSKCDHHIIANSSFSWWGAWLNFSPTKKVIAPDPWFPPGPPNHDTSDLYCKGWIHI